MVFDSIILGLSGVTQLGSWKLLKRLLNISYELMLRQIVIPAKAGIQNLLILLDSGFLRNDGNYSNLLIYEGVA